MEKTALKKMGKKTVDDLLDRMTAHSRKVVRTKVNKDGVVSQLDGALVFRTPDALPTSEIADPSRPSVRVELNTAAPLKLRDLADKSRTPLHRTGTSQPPVATPTAPKKPASSKPATSKPVVTKTTARDKRARERSSSPDDESIDLVPRRTTGGKSPLLLKNNPAQKPKRTAGNERAGGADSPVPTEQALADHIEDLAVEAGARVEPFSQGMYIATINAELEKRAPTNQSSEKRKSDEPAGPSTAKRAKSAAQDLWEGTGDVELEINDVPEFTNFKLPLFSHEHLAAGFHKFSGLALADGFHAETCGLKEAAVVTTHAAHLLFLSAHKEAKAAAEHKKTSLLAQARSVQLKERANQLAQANKDKAELSRKAASLTAMQPVLKKSQEDLQKEKAARLACMKQLEGVQEELARAKVEKAKILKDGVAREEALKKENARREDALKREGDERENAVRSELSRATNEVRRQREQIKHLQDEKQRVVDEFRTSPGLQEEFLRAKREAFIEGLASNLRVFSHYECLDLEKYHQGRKDPVLRESVPPDVYAQQWAHLEDDDGDSEDDSDADVIIVEGETSQAAPAENPDVLALSPIFTAVPLAERAPVETAAPAEVAPSPKKALEAPPALRLSCSSVIELHVNMSLRALMNEKSLHNSVLFDFALGTVRHIVR